MNQSEQDTYEAGREGEIALHDVDIKAEEVFGSI